VGDVPPVWDWEDPAGLERIEGEFTRDLARCQKLEAVPAIPPFGRQQLLDLGITGVEFAAFKTGHPAGLGTDLVGLRSPDGGTRPGPIYRVDGQCWFTQLDVCRPLPFADHSVEWVYAEHLIEHVPLPDGIRWLTEVRRILTPGGLLRLTTPDLRKYVEGYVAEDRFFAKHRRRVKLAIGIAPPMPDRRAFMFNQIFYLYGHRWIYDREELHHALGRAGFDPDSVRDCGYRDGARPDVADLDQTFRNDETIYVEVTVQS
jgi:predicted SAM-dependent methyltransferase